MQGLLIYYLFHVAAEGATAAQLPQPHMKEKEANYEPGEWKFNCYTYNFIIIVWLLKTPLIRHYHHKVMIENQNQNLM